MNAQTQVQVQVHRLSTIISLSLPRYENIKEGKPLTGPHSIQGNAPPKISTVSLSVSLDVSIYLSAVLPTETAAVCIVYIHGI